MARDPKTFGDDPPAPDPKLKRSELDKIAADAGVPNPDDLPNKEAVIEAIEAPNPALATVPDPDGEPREREYVVIGPHRVHDTEPGGKFTALIQPVQEALLIESGHVKRTDS